MQSRRKLLALILLLAGLLLGGASLSADTKSRNIILSTTTSTRDSGLFDVLIPLFETQTGQSVKTISVGTGQALALAARGDADVVLVHAPALEKIYLDGRKLFNRRPVMYNDFVIIGPVEDPAKVRSSKSAIEALQVIERAKAPFVSRGDESGTHQLEKSLWKQAGIDPNGSWHMETGQGMGATLNIANQRNAYTLTDRGTYLAFQKRMTLPILVEGDRVLLNIYSVMEVNPANGPRVNAVGGKAFADFLVSPRAQIVIKTFGLQRYSQPLFIPLAGRPELDPGA